jgi:hypothetical protein
MSKVTPLPSDRRCCDRGWVYVVGGSTPTVRPCGIHRSAMFLRWEFGAFRPVIPDWWTEAA